MTGRKTTNMSDIENRLYTARQAARICKFLAAFNLLAWLVGAIYGTPNDLSVLIILTNVVLFLSLIGVVSGLVAFISRPGNIPKEKMKGVTTMGLVLGIFFNILAAFIAFMDRLIVGFAGG
jgi:hypothetical protein